MAERYEHLEKALCKELEKLDKKYGGDVSDMTDADLEHADKIYHALKSAETYHAMKDATEMGDQEMRGEYSGTSYRMARMARNRSYDDGGSYARYRSPRTGRYVSRDGMDGGYSGNYPMEYIDPYWDRRY